MASKKIANANSKDLPPIQKKTVLQQVMKPKDWVSLLVLVVFSAVCWMWVLNAYAQPIDTDMIVGTNKTALDNR